MINIAANLDLMAVLGAAHSILGDLLGFAGGLVSVLPAVGLG